MKASIAVAAAFAALVSGSLVWESPALAADAPAMKIVDRIAGADGGWDFAAFDPVRRRLYVARNDGVMAVDVDSGRVTPHLLAGLKVHAALPLPGGDEILTTNGGNDTALIADARTGAVRATVATGQKPDAAVYDPASGLALVMNGKSGDVTLIDLKAGKAVGAIPVGGALESAAADGAGKVFVNVEDKSEIAVIDVAARKVVAHYPMTGCVEPSGLAYAPQGRMLIAACANAMAEAVSADTGRVVATLAIGPRPDSAFYDPKREVVYIPSGGDGTLATIAVSSPDRVSVISQAATQKGARTGAVDPQTGRVFLPVVRYAPTTAAAERPIPAPGTFEILVLGDR